jgi:cation diffusion facilitator CzcD-associated flavoprotein CzcO
VKQSSGDVDRKTDLLIVGAGPFGLAMAAYAKHLGIEHLIVGKPMGFWNANMPKGMYLRSACDWPLDPLNVKLCPKTRVVKCRELASGDLAVSMDNGQEITVDHIVLATGYKVEFNQIPLLQDSKILGGLNIQDGFPELDEHFQSSVPGMFITSMPAVQQFGPFFAFTIVVRASARLIGRAIFAQASSRSEPPLAKATL